LCFAVGDHSRTGDRQRCFVLFQQTPLRFLQPSGRLDIMKRTLKANPLIFQTDNIVVFLTGNVFEPSMKCLIAKHNVDVCFDNSSEIFKNNQKMQTF
jgi:hypothetical protein